jgi:hypothetical protein
MQLDRRTPFPRLQISALIAMHSAWSQASGQAVRRRDFIKGIVGSATAWPLTARAAAERRIGILMGYAETDPEGQAFAAAFRDELSNKFGWAQGRNIQIDTRWAAPNNAR